MTFWYPKTREAWKITVPAFHALEPFLEPDPRHELLDGVIYALPIPSTAHSVVLGRLHRQFFGQERPGLCAWSGGIRLSEVSEPWPDFSLLSAEPDARQPYSPDASEARLVIEVAHPEADFETGPKARAYQAAGVPEYWVVDVQACHVLRYLAPDYRSETFAGSAPEGLLNAPSVPPLSPQAYPDVSIDVGALFTGL
jgi:Uma2 family endonuclease